MNQTRAGLTLALAAIARSRPASHSFLIMGVATRGGMRARLHIRWSSSGTASNLHGRRFDAIVVGGGHNGLVAVGLQSAPEPQT